MRAAIAAFPGKVSLYAKNLDTGATYGFSENELVRTASTIKLGIMATVFNAVENKKATFADEVILKDSDKATGAGVLFEFSEGDKLTIRDLVRLMIVVSDNTATNLLLDRFNADSVNAFLDSIGLSKTRSLKKIIAGSSAAAGLSEAGRNTDNQRFGIGMTTPFEMVLFMEKLELGKIVSPEASKEMLAILKRQQDRNGIARSINDTVIANKTGALDRLRSDVGIVYSAEGRIAIAITCEDIPQILYAADNAGLLKISELTGILVKGLSKP
jgi:beta-lactamase class A